MLDTSMAITTNSISTYVFDLDGVVYLGDQVIPGATDSINELMSRKKIVYFLTNNSSVTRLAYVNKLGRMGIDVDKSQIYTSAFATAMHLKTTAVEHANVFVIGESGVQQEIKDVGLNVFSEPGSINPSDVDYVVIGIDRSFSYAKLSFGHECIVRGRAEFIATNRDTTYPSEIGTVPGAGSRVISLASSTAREPLNMGKPAPTALLEIIKAAGSNLDSTLMVGDRLDTDIACGNLAGTHSALVLTGVTPIDEARKAEGHLKPGLIIGSLTKLL